MASPAFVVPLLGISDLSIALYTPRARGSSVYDVRAQATDLQSNEMRCGVAVGVVAVGLGAARKLNPQKRVRKGSIVRFSAVGDVAVRGATTEAADGQISALKDELCSLCGEGAGGRNRVEAAQRVEDICAELSRCYQAPTVQQASEVMEGRWRLLTTFTPGQAAASITSLDSWREYVFGKGPSPVQAATLSSEAASRVYQVVELDKTPGRWHNVVDAQPFGIACIQADLELKPLENKDGSALNFQWTGGMIVINRLPWSDQDLGTPIKFPYPVPFKLLGDRARGSFDTMFLDDDLRIAAGSKSGSIFVLVRESSSLPMESEYYNP